MKKTVLLPLLFATIVASAQHYDLKLDTVRSTSRDFHFTNGPSFSVGPLLFIDTVEVSEDELKAVNPDNIESIEVLKDTTATTRYGERARHGVVILRMKRPRKPKPE
jgi:hypothetical protein